MTTFQFLLKLNYLFFRTDWSIFVAIYDVNATYFRLTFSFNHQAFTLSPLSLSDVNYVELINL